MSRYELIGLEIIGGIKSLQNGINESESMSDKWRRKQVAAEPRSLSARKRRRWQQCDCQLDCGVVLVVAGEQWQGKKELATPLTMGSDVAFCFWRALSRAILPCPEEKSLVIPDQLHIRFLGASEKA